MGFLKSMLFTFLINAVISLVFSLPVWLLWNVGPHELNHNLPEISYLAVASTVGLVGTLFMLIYFGMGMLKGGIKAAMEEL